MASTKMISTSGDSPVNGKSCHSMRSEIWAEIFPRWVLVLIGGSIIAAVVFIGRGMFALQAEAAVIRVDVAHVKAAQAEQKQDMKEYGATLHRIERAVNGGH